jgi:hypothetical protein
LRYHALIIIQFQLELVVVTRQGFEIRRQDQNLQNFLKKHQAIVGRVGSDDLSRFFKIRKSEQSKFPLRQIELHTVRLQLFDYENWSRHRLYTLIYMYATVLLLSHPFNILAYMTYPSISFTMAFLVKQIVVKAFLMGEKPTVGRAGPSFRSAARDVTHVQSCPSREKFDAFGRIPNPKHSAVPGLKCFLVVIYTL